MVVNTAISLLSAVSNAGIHVPLSWVDNNNPLPCILVHVLNLLHVVVG